MNEDAKFFYNLTLSAVYLTSEEVMYSLSNILDNSIIENNLILTLEAMLPKQPITAKFVPLALEYSSLLMQSWSSSLSKGNWTEVT